MKNQKVTNSEREARALTEEIERATAGVEAVAAAEGGQEGAGAVKRENVMSKRSRADQARIGSRVAGLPMADTTEVGVIEDQAMGAGAEIGVGDDRGLESESEAERNVEGLEAAERQDDQRELAVDEAELTEAENFVGTETQLQVGERLRDDREDYLTELGKGSPRDFKIMTANTERLTNEAMMAVQHLIKEEAVHPARLAQVRHKMMVSLLKDAYSRVFGDRN